MHDVSILCTLGGNGKQIFGDAWWLEVTPLAPSLGPQRSVLSAVLDTAPSLRSGVAEAALAPLQPSMAMRQLYRKVGVGKGMEQVGQRAW